MCPYGVYRWVVSLGWEFVVYVENLSQALGYATALEEQRIPARVVMGHPPKVVYQSSENEGA